MELLPILYWVFLVLALWGCSPWFPAAGRPYAPAGFCLLLIILLGLRVFPISLH
jgi:hypothetical protein